ncbi:MAG: efflux RND transporter periplasmic adaptor subunit, partial [Candidatus Tectomicrobia bacterium]|nr:efflux RND transporter periplasmic adaptor subunit [Candidatus Tectomicrobia bacterium]
MTTERPSRWRALLILPPILLGMVVLVWLIAGQQPPAKTERGEPARPVRVIEAPQLELVPTAEGYGPVQPARVWMAVAQVAGRVVKIHPHLRDGEILPEGAELVRIDPVDYELALAQTQAELAELDVREQNARASLTIEARHLTLAQRELERQRGLRQKGTAAQSTVDEAERAMLSSRTVVQNLRNTLALIPAQRRLLEAKSAQAKRALDHTVIRAPFTMRVASLQVETDQFVSTGQTLFEGDAVERVEIQAQMAL